ncbi:MAG: hypothetical protein NC548_29750 [Lachnospiraceae bacterium]|nr:hypothetical protein [Lachnospiraceae bacterium]
MDTITSVYDGTNVKQSRVKYRAGDIVDIISEYVRVLNYKVNDDLSITMAVDGNVNGAVKALRTKCFEKPVRVKTDWKTTISLVPCAA